MKLWLLQCNKDFGYYDTARGFVVRAATQDDARQLADQEGWDETDAIHHPWLIPELTSCVELTAAGEPGVILADYLEG